MEIIRAKVLGFCFGVKRAVDLVEEETEQRGSLSTLGSVVHNPSVVEDLSQKGAKVVKSLEEVPTDTVTITAHGVAPAVYEKVKEMGLNLVDATCPIVSKSQKAAYELAEEGFKVVIYGEENHPEMRGVLGWSKGCSIATLDPEIDIAIPKRKVALISQTTKSEESFAEFVGKFVAKNLGLINELRVINTTCPETDERYDAAKELAKTVDLMIVVGGKNSANTRKLAHTCDSQGVETHQLETADEIERQWLVGKERVGVTAGASTPDSAIEEVEKRLRSMA